MRNDDQNSGRRKIEDNKNVWSSNSMWSSNSITQSRDINTQSQNLNLVDFLGKIKKEMNALRIELMNNIEMQIKNISQQQEAKNNKFAKILAEMMG